MVSMPHWPKPVGLLQNETSLQRMQAILARLGDPHKKLPPVVHVAGTNGKGSTIAFLRAMLEAAGKKVHSYNTPHLINFNERINLAGNLITDNMLFEVMEEVRINSEDIRLGFYEATTAGAFLAFSKVNADYLLLETGMGGRLDATNIIDTPLLTILTTISKDHTEFLGNDIRLIAGEKLGIVKEGTTLISSLQHDVIETIIDAFCTARAIPLLAFGSDFSIDKTEVGFKYLSQDNNILLPNPSLLGEHQYINAANAITAALHLGLKEEQIVKGVTTTEWPSRLEKIDAPYVPKNWEFYLDGAHNPAGAYVIANHLDNWQDRPVYLIFCTTKGREVKDFLEKFQNKIKRLSLVKIHFEPASYEPEEMLPAAKELGFQTSTHDNLQEAIKWLHRQNPSPARVLACGSLFMRGDI